MKTISNKIVTFINGVTNADVWIMPDTEKNRKTTLWGAATVPKIKTGESRQAPLCESGDKGLYIIRMIDDEGFFYSCIGIELEDGCTVNIKENDSSFVSAEITDRNGVVKNTYEVFSARL